MNIPNNSLPRHIAIIMDGNGRWAKKRFLPRTMGHKAAVKNVRAVIESCVDIGVEYLTLFAFGRENWLRPKVEVDTLMSLFKKVLYSEIDELNKNGVQYKIIGDRSRLSDDLLEAINIAENKTKDNNKLKLRVAIDYSGQWDILTAVKQVALKLNRGLINLDQINTEFFSKELITNNDPHPDLLIRTSGETRISNFMLWQLSYAELYFTERLWPDFTRPDLEKAIEFFINRERRFGKISEQITDPS
ncbi:isoprenyl transferase [Francisellaceae bacterium]|nr:isoprenyl transferase [Francisellaceae bacterium]